MSLTTLAFILGPTCVTGGLVILLLGFLTKKPKLKEQRPKAEQDFWPHYNPTRKAK